MAWTDDEISKLQQLFNQGYSHQEIMKALGKTKGSVIGKCNRLGLIVKKPKKTGPKQKITLKSDKIILNLIKQKTDKWGWGLEADEILEYTRFPMKVVFQSIQRLLNSGHINKTVSNVADHIFYNDSSVKQR